MGAWTIYWILKLDAIGAFFGAIGVVGVVFGIVLFVCMGVWYCDYIEGKDEAEGSYKKQSSENSLSWFKILKRFVPIPLVCFVFLMVGIMFPTTNQMATIIVAPKIINNEQIQQIPEKLLELGNKQIDKWINGLTTDGKTKKVKSGV